MLPEDSCSSTCISRKLGFSDMSYQPYDRIESKSLSTYVKSLEINVFDMVFGFLRVYFIYIALQYWIVLYSNKKYKNIC